MIEDKLGKYPRHYYARYEGSEVAEVWMLTADDVISLVLPRAKKQYETKRSGKAKDPRIGVSISAGDIQRLGTRLK